MEFVIFLVIFRLLAVQDIKNSILLTKTYDKTYFKMLVFFYAFLLQTYFAPMKYNLCNWSSVELNPHEKLKLKIYVY